MEPKPIFPNLISTMTHPDQPKNKGPVPLFDASKPNPTGPKVFVPPAKVSSTPAPPVQSGPKAFVAPLVPTKPVVPVVPATGPKAFTPPPPQQKAPSNTGKVLFVDKAIGVDVEDPFYKNHPLCQKLSQKDIGRVRHIVMNEKVQDAAYVLEYADELRTRFATLVDGIIREQSSGKTATITDKIQELTQAIEKSKQIIDVVVNPPKKEGGLIGWMKSAPKMPTVREAMATISSTSSLVSRLSAELEHDVDELLSLIHSFDQVFKDNQDNFAMLNMHVVAGRIIVDKHNTITIPKMEQEIDPSNIFQSQDVMYFKDSVNRFDRKVDELEKIAHSVVLNAPAIRMMQMASKDRADRIQRLCQSIVPVWKQQWVVVVEALSKGQTDDLWDAVTTETFQRKKAVMVELLDSFQQFKVIFT